MPVWILGSSLYGAQLAALLGLPYTFASHFAPAELHHALEVYRTRFQPSAQLDKPHVMLGLNVSAAPTDAEAKLLFSSLQPSSICAAAGLGNCRRRSRITTISTRWPERSIEVAAEWRDKHVS
ncbi:LLM class flavin-dependent oxidoreductase [Mesorhizobium sp. J8]|nr:LLM class flavin-dependent oxidoreductase [Mesorhizobium sp. J8]